MDQEMYYFYYRFRQVKEAGFSGGEGTLFRCFDSEGDIAALWPASTHSSCNVFLERRGLLLRLPFSSFGLAICWALLRSNAAAAACYTGSTA